MFIHSVYLISLVHSIIQSMKIIKKQRIAAYISLEYDYDSAKMIIRWSEFATGVFYSSNAEGQKTNVIRFVYYFCCTLMIWYTWQMTCFAPVLLTTHACTKWKIRRTFFALMYSYFSYYFNYVVLFSNVTSTNGSETKFVGRLRLSTNHYEDGSES